MNTYTINKGYDDQRTVAATDFMTVGEFVDFFGRSADGGRTTVLRVRADRVWNIELTELAIR
ncbi:hypothetical protein ACGFYP_09520 [Streptomyces sp. NPDC048370]|uniref:hypothetical protein n=1 Tax=Streptomyces sp. NPDC048370 TaxID=3365540 RepID=UPI00371DF1B0